MTWEAVARKDFADAVRSRWLWALSVIFIVFFTVPAFFFADRLGGAFQEQGVQLSSDTFLTLLAQVNAFFVPVIAIVLAYAAVAGERDSGTLKLLLSLPHSRRDVVVGKILGRGAVVAVPLFVGFAVAALVFLVTPVTFAAGNYLLFALLTALLGLTFVAIAVGISAAAETNRQAMVGTVSLFVLFTLFWNRFSDGLVRLLADHTEVSNETLVKLHLFVKVLNPTQAYETLAAALVSGSALGARTSLVGGGGMQGQLTQQVYAQALGDAVPFYLSDPFVVLVLLAWLAAVPLAGYAVFRDADL